MAKTIPEALALIREPNEETDAKRFLARAEMKDRALAAKLNLLRTVMALTPKPVTEDEEESQRRDADAAKILEAVRANRTETTDISRITPDTSGLGNMDRPAPDRSRR